MMTPFQASKLKILHDLGESPDVYSDKSPKGSVDANIVDLIGLINDSKDYVTTSSCSGRISVYLEGAKSTHGEGRKVASRGGGKGGGGSFLFVSHDPMILKDLSEEECGSGEGEDDLLMSKFGLIRTTSAGRPVHPPTLSTGRFIHFKFEPMILHVLAASMQSALAIVAAGLEAGFRESGIVASPSYSWQSNSGSSSSSRNSVRASIRASGLGFDSIIGYLSDDHSAPSPDVARSANNTTINCSFEEADNGKQERIAVVDEAYLRLLAQTANERFKVNEERTQRFRTCMSRRKELLEQTVSANTNGNARAGREHWEDAAVRAQRKRAEGLLKQAFLQKNQDGEEKGIFDDALEMSGLDVLENV